MTMALVSPGVQISINDQSQYVNSNVGSVPLVVLATAQNKTYNGATAVGTTAAYAGKLQSFTSQRDLVTALGTPTFQLSSTGTPVNGSELNEYGLLTAYSALGLGNQLYAIRANIDLNQLTGTSIRPTGTEADGTYWLDINNTEFGIYSLNSSTSSFTSIDSNLLKITSASQITQDTNTGSYSFTVPAPVSSVGNPGQYALVFDSNVGASASAIRLFYKGTTTSISANVAGALNNTWVQVGSPAWQNCVPTVQGTVSAPSITASSTLQINGSNVTVSGSGLSNLVTAINNAAITGVSAASIGNQLTFFVTSLAASGAGTLSLVDGTYTPLAAAGIKTLSGSAISTVYGSPSVLYCPVLSYGTFAQTPSGGWYTTDTQPKPTGSIWWKTTATGGGFAPVFNQYSATAGTWNQLTVPFYSSYTNAIYGIDPTGGGINIPHGQVIATYGVNDSTYNSLRFAVELVATESIGTGGTPGTFTVSNQFSISATQPGTTNTTSALVTLTTTTAAGFVAAVLAANIPYVTATLNANGTISIIHNLGGQLTLTNITGTPLTTAGFVSGQGSGFNVNSVLNTITITNWSGITLQTQYSATTPYASPASGTYWYYSNPADIDIMINNNGWKAYRTVSSDVRGYALTATDVTGVIVSPTVPTSQVSGASLVAGDLWLNSGNLVNYPNISRYNGTSWVQINNQDHVSNNGIIFADARWDSSGTTDPISGSLPVISNGTGTGDLLNTTYIDQDAPNYQLYPRGTLLFNTRRSGYNVKKFVQNYFNSTSFPTLPNVPGAASNLPTATGTWVSASGLDQNGVMYAGSAAQRALVVQAMQSAVNSNTDVIESNYQFNLLCAPNYPELIPSLVALNNNRGDTGFVIGDTPMTLTPTATALSAWSNNTTGNGLATASPYLAVYYPAGLTTDLAGNNVVVPASHAALRTYLFNDNVSYPWFAPAGTHRGLVDNLSDIGYIDAASGSFIHNGINQGLRDALAQININPITQLPGVGLVIWGQETRSGDETSRNRVNVVRLENYLRTILNTISNGYLFEPNDTITRKSIATQIESALNNIVSHRGIYDYLVICDTSNNTPSTIANNQLYVDVAIEPMKDVEFIYIPIALYNPGTIAALGATST